VVEGSLSFAMTPEAATSVADAFADDATRADVSAAFAGSIADGITGVDAADVQITEISVARRLTSRSLGSHDTGKLKVDYAITVPATVSDIGTKITALDATAVTTAVQTGLRNSGVQSLSAIEVASMETPTAPTALNKCMAEYMKVGGAMDQGNMDGICGAFDSFMTHCKEADWNKLSADEKAKTDNMPYDGAMKTKDQMCSPCGRSFQEMKMKMQGQGERRLGQHTGGDEMPAATCAKMDAFLDGPCTEAIFDPMEMACIEEEGLTYGITPAPTPAPDPAKSGPMCYMGGGKMDCAADGGDTSTESGCTSSGGTWFVQGQYESGCSPLRQLSSHAADQGSGYGYGYGMTLEEDFGSQFSKGSCYGGGQGVVCNVDEATCREGDGGERGGNGRYWYEPGYVSGYSGCCHCKYGCKETPNGVPVGSPEDTCTYNDPVSAGSCYYGSGKMECNVAEDKCEKSWYEPGYESAYSADAVDSTKAKGCCHCFGSCSNPAARTEACATRHYDGHPYPPPDPKAPKCGSDGLKYGDLKEFVEHKKKMCATPQ